MRKRKKSKNKQHKRPLPAQPPPKSPILLRQKWKLDWKYWVAILLAILLAIPGVITLQTRPTVSLEEPLDSRNVLSTPIVISNDGMLAFENFTVESFFIRIGYGNGNLEMGSIGRGYVPPNKTLEAGERETVPFMRFMSRNNSLIMQADVALIVRFSPYFIPFYSKTRVFRFTTTQQANGNLRLQQQPAGDALEKYENVVNEVEHAMHPHRQE